MSGSNMRERITAYAERRYGTKPEYLWSSTPDAAVFRCGNGKWYGIMMRVDGSRLGLEKGTYYDILNVKCSPLMTGSMLAVKGVLPAYHMNKNSWVSVLLDGTVEEEQITGLLDMSFGLVSQSGNSSRTEPRKWLIPASPAMYDVEQDFRRSGTIIWKQTARMIAGDTVYMYMAAPVSAVMYKLAVEEADIPFRYDNGSYHIRKAMKLKLLHRFSADDMPLSRMKELGAAAVRGPRGVPPTLLRELESLVRGNGR